MCGIFFYASKHILNIDDLKEKSNKIQHRGPDNSQFKILKINRYNIYINFHRLSINGLDVASNQPFENDGVFLICNGEIYNYKLLAEKYNIKLDTNSDCEIILKLYTMFGPLFINQLDGVFSFVIIDSVKDKVMVGHDPFGIRSLYYGFDEYGYGFSSEMKSLVNTTSNIELYKPGTYSIHDLDNNDDPLYIKYYNFQYDKLLDNSESYLIDNIRIKLYDSVKKRLLGERKIGCLLSGGLDSSIITSIVCNILGKENVKTFSIGLDGSPDTLAAKKVADHLGTIHTNVEITEQDITDNIENTIYQIESHDITTIRASIPMFLLSKYIRDNTNIKIILSGEGSDEASGSYLYFHNAPNSSEFQKECLRLLQDVHMFDALRGDKTTAGAGLEIRVPFFDKNFMKFYMGIDPKLKMVRDGHEKYLLRKAFESDLPYEIAWRRKDGFSDGVSKVDKPLYQIIDDYTMGKFGKHEKEYYDFIFDKYYANHRDTIPYLWMPKWNKKWNNNNTLDNPSGRLIL